MTRDGLIEICARSHAAKRMLLVHDLSGAGLPADIWRQAIPYVVPLVDIVLDECEEIAHHNGDTITAREIHMKLRHAL